MDKVKKNKQISKNIVLEVAQMLSKVQNFESMLLIDEERGQYLLMSDGWDNYGGTLE